MKSSIDIWTIVACVEGRLTFTTHDSNPNSAHPPTHKQSQSHLLHCMTYLQADCAWPSTLAHHWLKLLKPLSRRHLSLAAAHCAINQNQVLANDCWGKVVVVVQWQGW